MANPETAKNPAPTAPTTPAPANGAAAPAKAARPAREAPAIVCAPSKSEYDEIQGFVQAKLAGLPVEVSLGKLVLALALKQLRAQK